MRMRRQYELIAVPEIAVEAVPGEDLRQVFRGKVRQQAPIDQLAEYQPIGIEHAGQHVGLLGRIAAAHIAEPVQDLPDTPEDRLDALLFRLGLPDQELFERDPLLVKPFDPDQVISVLLAAWAGVARMLIPLLGQGVEYRSGLGELPLDPADIVFDQVHAGGRRARPSGRLRPGAARRRVEH